MNLLLLILGAISIVLFIYFLMYHENKQIDTSAIFKDIQGQTFYTTEECFGKYRVRKTYYKIGPIYNDSPICSYVLGQLPFNTGPSWDDTNQPSTYIKILYFDTLEEAQNNMEMIKKRDYDFWHPVQ